MSRAAQFYQSHSLFCHRPGPVYTIPEDANESDGTIDNTESRMIGTSTTAPPVFRFLAPEVTISVQLERRSDKRLAWSPTRSSACTVSRPPALLLKWARQQPVPRRRLPPPRTPSSASHREFIVSSYSS